MYFICIADHNQNQVVTKKQPRKDEESHDGKRPFSKHIKTTVSHNIPNDFLTEDSVLGSLDNSSFKMSGLVSKANKQVKSRGKRKEDVLSDKAFTSASVKNTKKISEKQVKSQVEHSFTFGNNTNTSQIMDSLENSIFNPRRASVVLASAPDDDFISFRAKRLENFESQDLNNESSFASVSQIFEQAGEISSLSKHSESESQYSACNSNTEISGASTSSIHAAFDKSIREKQQNTVSLESVDILKRKPESGQSDINDGKDMVKDRYLLDQHNKEHADCSLNDSRDGEEESSLSISEYCAITKDGKFDLNGTTEHHNLQDTGHMVEKAKVVVRCGLNSKQSIGLYEGKCDQQIKDSKPEASANVNGTYERESKTSYSDRSEFSDDRKFDQILKDIQPNTCQILEEVEDLESCVSYGENTALLHVELCAPEMKGIETDVSDNMNELSEIESQSSSSESESSGDCSVRKFQVTNTQDNVLETQNKPTSSDGDDSDNCMFKQNCHKVPQSDIESLKDMSERQTDELSSSAENENMISDVLFEEKNEQNSCGNGNKVSESQFREINVRGGKRDFKDNELFKEKLQKMSKRKKKDLKEMQESGYQVRSVLSNELFNTETIGNRSVEQNKSNLAQNRFRLCHNSKDLSKCSRSVNEYSSSSVVRHNKLCDTNQCISEFENTAGQPNMTQVTSQSTDSSEDEVKCFAEGDNREKSIKTNMKTSIKRINNMLKNQKHRQMHRLVDGNPTSLQTGCVVRRFKHCNRKAKMVEIPFEQIICENGHMVCRQLKKNLSSQKQSPCKDCDRCGRVKVNVNDGPSVTDEGKMAGSLRKKCSVGIDEIADSAEGIEDTEELADNRTNNCNGSENRNYMQEENKVGLTDTNFCTESRNYRKEKNLIKTGINFENAGKVETHINRNITDKTDQTRPLARKCSVGIIEIADNTHDDLCTVDVEDAETSSSDNSETTEDLHEKRGMGAKETNFSPVIQESSSQKQVRFTVESPLYKLNQDQDDNVELDKSNSLQDRKTKSPMKNAKTKGLNKSERKLRVRVKSTTIDKRRGVHIACEVTIDQPVGPKTKVRTGIIEIADNTHDQCTVDVEDTETSGSDNSENTDDLQEKSDTGVKESHFYPIVQESSSSNTAEKTNLRSKRSCQKQVRFTVESPLYKLNQDQDDNVELDESNSLQDRKTKSPVKSAKTKGPSESKRKSRVQVKSPTIDKRRGVHRKGACEVTIGQSVGPKSKGKVRTGKMRARNVRNPVLNEKNKVDTVSERSEEGDVCKMSVINVRNRNTVSSKRNMKGASSTDVLLQNSKGKTLNRNLRSSAGNEIISENCARQSSKESGKRLVPKRNANRQVVIEINAQSKAIDSISSLERNVTSQVGNEIITEDFLWDGSKERCLIPKRNAKKIVQGETNGRNTAVYNSKQLHFRNPIDEEIVTKDTVSHNSKIIDWHKMPKRNTKKPSHFGQSEVNIENGETGELPEKRVRKHVADELITEDFVTDKSKVRERHQMPKRNAKQIVKSDINTENNTNESSEERDVMDQTEIITEDSLNECESGKSMCKLLKRKARKSGRGDVNKENITSESLNKRDIGNLVDTGINARKTESDKLMGKVKSKSQRRRFQPEIDMEESTCIKKSRGKRVHKGLKIGIRQRLNCRVRTSNHNAESQARKPRDSAAEQEKATKGKMRNDSGGENGKSKYGRETIQQKPKNISTGK